MPGYLCLLSWETQCGKKSDSASLESMMGLEEEIFAQVWGKEDVGIGTGWSGKKQSIRKKEKGEGG